MKSIINRLGTEDIPRIRIGIGEPTYNSIDYVLGKPSEEEAVKLDEATTNAAKALREIAVHSFTLAMNRFNTKEKK